MREKTPFDFRVPVLTQGTPLAEQLIQKLKRQRAILPDWAWKDLFLLALEKCAERGREVVARYLAGAACSLTSGKIFPVEKHMKFWNDLLSQVRSQKVGRGHLDKLTRTMDPLTLHILFIQLRVALERARTDEDRKLALKKPWKMMKGTVRVPERLEEIAVTNKPTDAALQVVASAYGYQPESLKTIFHRNGFSLRAMDFTWSPSHEAAQQKLLTQMNLLQALSPDDLAVIVDVVRQYPREDAATLVKIIQTRLTHTNLWRPHDRDQNKGTS